MKTDEGERRSSWREHHGNVVVWRDDRGRKVWNHEYEYDYDEEKGGGAAGTEGRKAMLVQKKERRSSRRLTAGNLTRKTRLDRRRNAPTAVVVESCSEAQRRQLPLD